LAVAVEVPTLLVLEVPVVPVALRAAAAAEVAAVRTPGVLVVPVALVTLKSSPSSKG
jgi:hypothetical protein